jgi:YHS domain-containing protein
MFMVALRIFVIVMTILIVLRLLRRLYEARRLHVPPAATPQGIRETTVKDPVCGMYLDPRLAIRLEHNNGVFFFCSDSCRQKFDLSGHRTAN